MLKTNIYTLYFTKKVRFLFEEKTQKKLLADTANKNTVL